MAKKTRQEAEYILNIFYYYDEATRKKKVVFLVRTIQEFVSFNYEILLDASLEDRTIRLNIVGLNAPSMLMPGTGPARGRKEFADLNGMYSVVVRKLDGTSNEFQVEISPRKIQILQSPSAPFVLASTTPVIP